MLPLPLPLLISGPVAEVDAQRLRPRTPTRPDALVSETDSPAPKSPLCSTSSSPGLSRREQRRANRPRHQELAVDLLPANAEDAGSEDSDVDQYELAASEEIVDLSDRLLELEVDFGDGRPVVRGDKPASSKSKKTRRKKQPAKESKDCVTANDKETDLPLDRSIVFGDQLLAVVLSGNMAGLQDLLMQCVQQASATPATPIEAVSMDCENHGESVSQESATYAEGEDACFRHVASAESPSYNAKPTAEEESNACTCTHGQAIASSSVEVAAARALETPPVRSRHEFDATSVQQCPAVQKLLNSPQGTAQRHLLVAASQAGHAEVVQFLLESGADPISK